MARMSIVATLLLLAPGGVSAADFCADRPGLSTGTCVVPRSEWQVETEVASWSIDRRAGVRTTQTAVASTMLRIGIAPKAEIRLSFDPWIEQRTRGDGQRDRARGSGDLVIGVKQRLTNDQARLAVALLPQLKLPVARKPIGNRRFEVGLLAPLTTDLAGGWALTLTPESNWLADSDDHGHHLQAAMTGSIGKSVDDRTSIAIDIGWARDFDPSGHASSASAGLSLAWMATPTLQLDGAVTTGLGGDAADLGLSFGFAYRPKPRLH